MHEVPKGVVSFLLFSVFLHLMNTHSLCATTCVIVGFVDDSADFTVPNINSFTAARPMFIVLHSVPKTH